MSGPNGSGESEGGPATLAIEERDGAIVLYIGETYAILKPDQAIEIGEMIVQYGSNQNPGSIAMPSARAQTIISEKIRNKLYQRTSLVIKNLQERKKLPMYVAQSVVDIVLSEVL